MSNCKMLRWFEACDNYRLLNLVDEEAKGGRSGGEVKFKSNNGPFGKWAVAKHPMTGGSHGTTNGREE